jgi:two-component system, NtrC family, sensor kinase
MLRKPRFPIRVKILAALLLILTLVVSVITFTMARLFHEDKKAYLHDLSSIVALTTADECRSLMLGYAERLQSFARLRLNEELGPESRSAALRQLVSEFPDLVWIGLHDGDREIEVAYDRKLMEAAGVSPKEIEKFRVEHPVPAGAIAAGEIFVRNSTVTPRLPTFTIALAPASKTASRSLVATAVLRTDALQALVSRSRVLDLFLADAEGIYLADTHPGRVSSRAVAAPLAGVQSEVGKLSASMTREYDLGGIPMVGGFSPVEVGGIVVGAQIPKSAAYLASRDLLRSVVVVAFALLALATLVGLLWARTITRSLEKLSRATRTIGTGQFDVKVEEGANDEIGTLAASFNQMVTELKARETALQEAQAQLVQSEKMAAFGQIGAGIAHEVKNPLAGILGCAQLCLRKAEKGSSIEKNLELIEKETKRCKTIIENLLKFARQEQAALSAVSVNAVVQDAAAIVNHQLEIHQVKLDTDFGMGIPPVHANANQLQQVLLNLLINAQQAMEGTPGSVRVSTRSAGGGRVEIRVADSGPGMAPEVKAKIFDPFFTTKPGGKGTGLGLSVSYGIIREHRGEISVETEPGKGATFIIMLPAMSSTSVEQPAAEEIAYA